ERPNQRADGYRSGDFDIAKSCLLQIAPCLKSKPAARDVDHVAILDILWSRRPAVNGWPKINGLSALFSVDYASQMNIAGASVVTHSARFHNRLVHSRRPIKNNSARSVGKPGHNYRCRTVFQRDQHFTVFKLPFVVVDKFMLKIDRPLAGSRDFADKRETHLAVSANSLRLIGNAFVGIGNLDHISGREPYWYFRTWRIQQRR